MAQSPFRKWNGQNFRAACMDVLWATPPRWFRMHPGTFTFLDITLVCDGTGVWHLPCYFGHGPRSARVSHQHRHVHVHVRVLLWPGT